MESKGTIIVTGGGRGIGRAITERLLNEGYHVHICSRDGEALAKAAGELSSLGSVTFTALDLGNREEVKQFVADWNKPLYGIVNNAGVCITERLDENRDAWDTVLNTNLVAPYLLTKNLLAHLVPKGRVINIASQLGKEGRAGYSAYCASKFALVGLTKVWAKELGGQGITVNAICPGWVDTEMSRKDMERIAAEKGVTTQEYYKQICEPLELKRFTDPHEVANLVNFLLSKEGSGITGRDILLNTIWNQE